MARNNSGHIVIATHVEPTQNGLNPAPERPLKGKGKGKKDKGNETGKTKPKGKGKGKKDK